MSGRSTGVVIPFPHVIVRWNPRNFENLTPLRSTRLQDVLADLALCEEQHRSGRDQILSILDAKLRSTERALGTGNLLDLKRQLQRSLPLRERDRRTLRDLGQGDLSTAFVDHDANARAADRTLHAAHALAIREALGHIRALVQDPDLARAIAIASPSLWEKLTGRVDSPELRKEWVALSRYVYRAYCKTSPFSWFTVIGSASPARGSQSRSRRVSVVRPSGFLLNFIWRQIGQIPELKSKLTVVANPTARVDGDRLWWYVNHANEEYVREAPLRTPVGAFLERMMDYPATTVAALVSEVDTDPRIHEYGAERLTLELIDAGFLLPVPPFRIDDPDAAAKLSTWLEAHSAGEVEAIEIAKSVARLVSAVQQALGPADADRRLLILNSARDALRQSAARIGEPSRQASADMSTGPRPREEEGFLARGALFFEDVGSATPFKISHGEIGDLCSSLESLARESGLLSSKLVGRRSLARFLGERVGWNTRISVLEAFRLLQDYRRGALRGRKGEPTPSMFGSQEELARWSAERSRWLNRVTSAAQYDPSTESVHLTSEGLASCRPVTLPDEIREGISRSCRVLVGSAGKSITWVLHNPVIEAGNGRAFSRFLELLPPRVTSDLWAYNRALPYWGETVENVDHSLFNGNFHPPLTNRAISFLPPRTPDQRNCSLGVSELWIELRGEAEADAGLVAASGERVRMCDLGLQTYGRSALFELLNLFTVNPEVFIEPLTRALTEAWHSRFGGAVMPRILWDGNVILQRRRWMLSPFLCSADAGGPADWYRKLQQTKERLGLPDQGFTRVVSSSRQPVNDRKPQFLHFADPLSCELLRRVYLTTVHDVQFEEMYPSPDMLPAHSAGRHQVEVIATWYCYPN